MDLFPDSKRKPLTKMQFGQLVAEQSGLCGCDQKCGRLLVFEKGQIRDEHLVQLSMGGTNDLSNRALLTLHCAKLKDVLDAGRRAKVRSLTKSTKKSQAPKAKIPSRPMQTKKDLGKDWARHDD